MGTGSDGYRIGTTIVIDYFKNKNSEKGGNYGPTLISNGLSCWRLVQNVRARDLRSL